MLVDVLKTLRPVVAQRLVNDHGEETVDAEAAEAFVAAVRDHKGPFAQQLAERLVATKDEPNGFDFVVPDYLSRALQWLTGDSPTRLT